MDEIGRDPPPPPDGIEGFDAELLAKIAGQRLRVGGNNPVMLDDPSQLWLVLRGHLDIYAVEALHGEVVGTGTHIVRVHPGSVLLGVQPLPLDDSASGRALHLRAVASLGTYLFQASRTDIEGEDFDIIVVDWIDRWVGYLSTALSGAHPPRGVGQLEAEPRQAFAAGTAVSAQYADTIWVAVDAGEARFLGSPAAPVRPDDPPLPITDRTWLGIDQPSVLSPVYTPTALLYGSLWPALDRFHLLVLRHLRATMVASREQEAARLQRQIQANNSIFDLALRRLGTVFGPPAALSPVPGEAGDELLLVALQAIGEQMGMQVRRPRQAIDRRVADPLHEICRASRMRSRNVLLERGWHRTDNGPLLGYLGDDRKPVALLPTGPRSYRMVDPATGEHRRVDAALAGTIAGGAVMLYRPLPPLPMSVKSVLRFAARGLAPDFRLIVAMGMLAGVIALLVPVLSGELFSEVIPRADLNTQASIVVALVFAALGTAVFEVVRGTALLRVQGRMDGVLQSAIWDRLLALPLSFFRRYTAGDLADRANSINAIREILTGVTVQAAIEAVFSVFSFALLFYYSWELALVTTGLVAAVLLVTLLLTVLQLPHQRALLEGSGKLQGVVFQCLVGIAKLRSSASETRAFARWAGHYAEIKRQTFSIRKLAALQRAFNAGFPSVATLTLFAYIVYGLLQADPPTEFNVGDFVAFNASLGQFLASMLTLTASLTTIIAIDPLYRRAQPILLAVPEVTDDKSDPGELQGAIDFSHVTFRYLAEGPPVLEDLSFSVRQGEYVAFVGGSGSGKSTILRLLLGFEQPESGGIYLDGKDLNSLDVAMVRAQIGVVLQSGRLMAGSIFDNIVGQTPLTLDDAMEAAEMAGLGDDIRAMPMGLQTVLSEGAGTLSGGQKQRLMIARALVRRPRILLLDEATSALDNRTQAVVNHSLDRLKLTRIVVAHRLSTIVNADRLFVVSEGRISETGTFRELMALGGEFAALASRQLV